MMSRAVPVILLVGSLCGVAIADKPRGNVIRPKKVDAKVKGCQVSEPGKYHATEGDLIELEYTFPIFPAAMPKKLDRETDRGPIFPSKLGIRNLIVPKLIGTGTHIFYFEARHEGEGTAFVVIDGVKYEFRFKVSEGPKPRK